LVLNAAAECGRSPLIMFVPVALILLGFRMIEALGLSLPVNRDNLEGFMANQAAHHISTLKD
jgi:hypothetical protein